MDIPTLVIHGENDRIVPFAASGKRTAALIRGARLVTIEDGPHGISWTHADQINPELGSFLGPSKEAVPAKPKKAVA